MLVVCEMVFRKKKRFLKRHSSHFLKPLMIEFLQLLPSGKLRIFYLGTGTLLYS